MRTEIKVFPKDWEKKTKANLAKEWYIYYFFNGRKIRVKGGVNYCKTLDEKQAMMRAIIAEENMNLKNGFNPITKEYDGHHSLRPDTPFIRSIKIALEKINVADSTRTEISNQIPIIEKSSNNIGLSGKPLQDVRKRDISLLLADVLDCGYSNDKFNRIRNYLSIIFKYFVQLDIFEYNFVRNIEKQPHTPERQKVYSTEDIEKLEDLKKLNYKLWRFLAIFHASQSRIIEMRELKIENVQYSEQTFKVFQKKGKFYKHVLKPINIHTAHLWKEVLDEAKEGDIYIFGNDLCPSAESCTATKLDAKFKYWRKKLGIKKSLYALRHTFANHIANTYGIGEAQRALGHTSQKTTEIYAVDYRENLVKSQANLDVALK